MVRSEPASLNRSLPQLRDDLQFILRRGVEAVEPGGLVAAALASLNPTNLSLSVVAAGKAAWSMFGAVASVISIEKGLVTASSSAGAHTAPGWEVYDAGHPAPNAASVTAGERSLALARASASKGELLVLLSGGASAMLSAPGLGLTLDDKVETARNLMAAGAAIHELNCVRKHLSRIKGGQLAAAARRTITLALSDVHGPVADDPTVIASGPTVPDETTFADALDVLRSRGVKPPFRVEEYLLRGARGEIDETIKPGDPAIGDSTYTVIGNRHTAVSGAIRAAEQRGYEAVVIRDATAGEARIAAVDFVSRIAVSPVARAARGRTQPLCVIGSGETTVTVRGNGRGGRNQEFVLAALSRLSDIGEAVVLGSAGTDGIDGPTSAAGGIVDSTSLTRAARIGVSPQSALARNDSNSFLEALGDLIVWGPTGTNVGDLHVLLIG